MADKTGYIGRNPGDSSVTIARQTYTPTSNTTEFTFTSGYTVGLCDVYLNGVKLVDTRDYDANTGSTVGLTSEAVSGDIVEIIAYKAFNLGQVNSASGNFTVGSNLSVGSTATLSGVTTCEGDLYVGGDLYGDGSNLTGIANTAYIDAINITSSGIVSVTNTTASTSSATGALIVSGGVGIAGSLHVGENVSIGGTLTYEDVTNIDSVGLITAQTGVKVTAGGIDITAGGLDVSAGISTFGGGDIQISGSAVGITSVTWDASADSLIFKDNSKAVFGDGSDLSIYHDSSNSYIADTGTGDLRLRGSKVVIQNSGGTASVVESDGTGVELYYSNSKKFYTSNTGVFITGICTATSFKGDGSALTNLPSAGISTAKAVGIAAFLG